MINMPDHPKLNIAGLREDDSSCTGDTALPPLPQQPHMDFYDDAIASHEKLILDHGLRT